MNIYIDENLPPQLAKGINILEQPNGDGIKVLSIKETFGEGSLDEDWIPKIGKLRGIVITQDFNIHRTRSQNELYMKNNLGIFFFKPPSRKGFTYWEMVEHIIKRWTEIKKLSKKTRRPFAFRCSVKGRIQKI